MKRSSVLILLALLTLWVVTAQAADPPAPKVWFVDSLVKIFPGDTAKSHPVVRPELVAARGQHVSVQLALRSKRAIDGVTAEVGPLKDSAGATLTGGTVRPEGYVVVGSHTRHTPEDELVGEAPGWFPDPLLDFPVSLKAKRTQPLWISVAVSADAQPGEYRGSVVVRVGGRQAVRRVIRVTVLAATVPSRRTLNVTNWFSFGDASTKQFYKIAQYSPEWWTLMSHLGTFMAEHRQNVILTPLMGLIEPRVEGTHLTYNFANFDRWVQTFQRAGAIGHIEGSHLLGRAGSYSAGLTVSTFQIEDGKAIEKTLPPDDPRVEAFLKGFLTALNTHLEEKGWKSIYYQHVLDEPHGAEPAYYARFAEMVHRYLPGVPTLDAVDISHLSANVSNNCDIWVPILGSFDAQMGIIEQHIATGHEVWFYTCLFPNGQYMNRLMDYPLIKTRLLPWLDFRYGFTGFLHWGWSHWTPDPLLDTQPVINANTTLLPSGDAFIVYPDRARMSVYSSIRMETMLEGIEDYEMLMALKAKNPAAADRLVRDSVSGPTDYVRDPQKFRELERELLEELAK